jgi:hypothetical protein
MPDGWMGEQREQRDGTGDIKKVKSETRVGSD